MFDPLPKLPRRLFRLRYRCPGAKAWRTKLFMGAGWAMNARRKLEGKGYETELHWRPIEPVDWQPFEHERAEQPLA